MHAERYMSLVKGEVDSGPAFSFPEVIAPPSNAVLVDDLQLLEHNFIDGRRTRFQNGRPSWR